MGDSARALRLTPGWSPFLAEGETYLAVSMPVEWPKGAVEQSLTSLCREAS